MSQDPQSNPESDPLSPRKISRKRSFDTFYLFCAILLILAIGTQIAAIIAYR